MNKHLLRKVSCFVTIVSVFFVPRFTRAGAEGISGTDYLSLDDKALGHIRHILRISEQVRGEGGSLGGTEDGQEYDIASSFQLLFFAYTLGLVHYHYTPAYREIYQGAMDRVIQKMLGRELSGHEVQTPGGSRAMNPAPKLLGGKSIEPLARENVMYSGHLFATVGYYTMLFRDKKYTEPGSLPFDYRVMFPGLSDPERYQHDFSSLAKLIADQYAASPMGFVCEPNGIFIFCNSYTFYGFRFHDHVFGTNYLPTVAKKFREAWEEKGGLLNKDRHFVEAYLILQDFIWAQPSAYFDAWAGTWMHAWNRDFIKSLYPEHAKHWVKWMPDGTAYVEPRPQSSWTLRSTSDFGHFAVYASELGDKNTVDAMLAYAEKYMKPTWDDGAYFFRRNDELKNEDGLPVLMTPLAGNALLALARINVPNGIYTTFNQPFEKEHFKEPYIDKVDYPNVLVRQAVYDAEKRALIVGVTPGEGRGKTTFRVNRLDVERDWEIFKNGARVGRLRRGKLEEQSRAAVDLKMEDRDVLKMTLELRHDENIIVKAVN